MKKLFIYLITCFLCITYSKAQDFHFSQYWASPLNLNPALTGLFDNNIRVAANYRNQWFQQNSFSTYAVSLDANLFRNKINGNFLGTGLGVYYDTENGGDFTNFGVSIPISYTQRLGGNKNKHYLGIGLQGNYISKQINLRNVVYGNLFEINNNTDPIDALNFDRKAVFDLSAGLNYFVNLDNKHALSVGFAMQHIAQPNISFTGNSDDLIFRKFTINGSAKLQLKDDFIAIIPTFLFQNQGPHTEFTFGSYLQFLINYRNNTSIYVGGQYRLAAYQDNGLGSDAFILGARFEYESLDIGFAYDITTSDLRNVAAFMGGPELYIIYTIPTSPSNSRSLLNCPKF